MATSQPRIRIAYLLLAHKEPEQINLFIRQLLAYGDCDIYIHVDKKQEWILDHICESENVTAISKYDVRWGGFGIPLAALELMRLARDSGNYYSHMYFGSCQDLLVRKGMYDYLAENPSSVYLTIYKRVTDSDRESARYRVKWPKRLLIRNDWHPYRFIRIAIQLLVSKGVVPWRNKAILTSPIDYFYGETWFICPNSVMLYILDFTESRPDYCEFWENSLASDLMFFQTIIMNSPYRNCVRDGLMYVVFGSTFGTKNHPLSVSIADNAAIEEKGSFCARKFELAEKEAIDFYLSKTLQD